MTINKRELADQLKEKYGYTKTDAMRIIDDITECIVDNVREGNPVNIYGFGCFDIIEKAAHRCYDVNHGGGVIDVPAAYGARFYPGASLKNAAIQYTDSVRKGIAKN